MKLLFTGPSSFTGFWFVRELVAAGHEVVAVFRREFEDYTEAPRAARVALLRERCRCHWGISFGDERFLRLVESEGEWDVLCHHAAEVGDYRSPDFDVMGAVASNTREAARVLDSLSSGGRRSLVLTGSIFEGGEGDGSDGVPTVSAYGLSKLLTAETFRFHCHRKGVALGKFVIPNPFGPYEEARLTSYLARTGLEEKTAAVRTPLYVRDNIHVSLLAKVYARFVSTLPTHEGFEKTSPSGYIESQGSFARRFAEAMRTRLGRACSLHIEKQTEFTQPRIRINTEVPDAVTLMWNEEEAWDGLAEYYKKAFGRG